MEGKKKITRVFSHWWKSIFHWGKTKAQKGKVIFYLCLQKAKIIFQNILFTSKFSLGLLLNHCFIPLPFSASKIMLKNINPVCYFQVVKALGKIPPAEDFFRISCVYMQKPFPKRFFLW